jgi:acetyltransferase-like isoleucine patch superfamily enzyme
LLKDVRNLTLRARSKIGARMITNDVTLGKDVTIHHPDLVNLYGCRLGDRTRVGTFVEIQKDVTIGSDCKISSHTFICSGVEIGNGVFVGHGVMFINDLYPRAVNQDGALQGASDWEVVPTRIADRVSLGSNCTILGGVSIGEGALVGAGAVVTRDVPPYAIVAGVPARVQGNSRANAHLKATVSGSSPIFRSNGLEVSTILRAKEATE